MSQYRIVVLTGDGIGPEITEEAVRVLKAVSIKHGFEVILTNALIGGAAIDTAGTSLPEETLEICQSSDAVLLGAVGGPKWDGHSGDRPEKGLLGLRSGLRLFANLRPAVIYPALKSASPLKSELLGDGLDLLVVRELTGGIYFGESGRKQVDGKVSAFDTEEYSEEEIRRIAKMAFELAGKRKKRLCSIDKANVLESSRLWRETVISVADDYPGVELSHMYVDNAAMQLVRNPGQFDTIVTGNMFGDILSDEASQLTGSIGMLPSASLNGSGLGMYEPIHGSAPDIAGENIANPIAAILSVAMLLRYSLSRPEAADDIEKAVEKVLNDGLRTADIEKKEGTVVGTREMGREILRRLKK